MKTRIALGQIVLRIGLGTGFILPVMDRLGWLGAPGSGVAWGNWANFVTYTNKLLPFLPAGGASLMGAVATIAEAVFGVCLIIGYRTWQAALGSAILTLIFGVCMAIFVNIAAPFKYPVFVFTGAGLLLSCITEYKWSVDRLIKPHSPS
jgi:uncharacterized membrane protein YphA (DoxX/SURF4 family)